MRSSTHRPDPPLPRQPILHDECADLERGREQVVLGRGVGLHSALVFGREVKLRQLDPLGIGFRSQAVIFSLRLRDIGLVRSPDLIHRAWEDGSREQGAVQAFCARLVLAPVQRRGIVLSDRVFPSRTFRTR